MTNEKMTDVEIARACINGTYIPNPMDADLICESIHDALASKSAEVNSLKAEVARLKHILTDAKTEIQMFLWHGVDDGFGGKYQANPEHAKELVDEIGVALASAPTQIKERE